MQGLGSSRGSNSTVDLELHRSSTPELHRSSTPELRAASTSTLVEHTTPASDALSVSDVSSVFYRSLTNDSIGPWWEAEAEKILRGSDLQSIQLLCRYHVYRDDCTPELILRERWPVRLNSFLLNLRAGTYSLSDVTDLDLDQKVREILKRLVPSVSAADTWRDLAPSTLFLEPNASRLASRLNEESLLRFQRITFVDYVREALYPEDTIETVVDFIDWHDSLFNQASDRLERFPNEAAKYAQIEQWLPEGSPVRWAVSESLRQAQSHRPNLEFVPQPDVEFIYGPLRDLFRDQHRDLAETLTKLAVLEARFQRGYLREEEIEWAQCFDTNTDFFDGATTNPPQDLADSLTEDDILAFENCALRASSARTPTFNTCTDDGTGYVERYKRASPLTAVSVIFLRTLLRRVSVQSVLNLLTLLIRNYISDTTTTANALYFNLNGKLPLTNLDYHIFLFSSIMTATTLLTGKYMK